MGVMFADFQANGRWPKEDRLNRADKWEARTAEQDLRTWAQIPSGSIAKAGSRLDRTFSTFLGEKNPKSSREWV